MGVYGYCRVSTARQGAEGESLAVQRQQIEGYAMMRGLVLDEVLVEEGVSGSIHVAERPAGVPLFAKLQLGDTLIAAKLDRMFRSALDALNTVEALKAKGVKLHLIDIGGDVSGNGVSALFFTILSAVAEFERSRPRERIGAAKFEQKARKRFLGGNKPFGYRVGGGGELVPDEAEQEALREMVRLRVEERRPLRVVVEAMAAKGHKISLQGVDNLVKTQAQQAAHRWAGR